eukprot:TRINITY_DN1711_c0_g1_i2.p1 TRINITY_DN1711_c0_g1~~TRINITY_DN1711_c0_g1_i2.p1  ORF type:complete len:199 (+),score=36.55 TRINITY_DN1711_c0_g1_i2:33-629(+)
MCIRDRVSTQSTGFLSLLAGAAMPLHREFQVIGRRRPTPTDKNPKIFRMRLFAPNSVLAKSRFWYFLCQVHKVKKNTGEILACNQISDPNPTVIKNFGFWLRYDSRMGTTNIYKEYRDLTRCDAVDQMYNDMAARHRARNRSIQILDLKPIAAKNTRRPNIKQFHNAAIRFPLPHRVMRTPSRKFRNTFRATKPSTFH